MDNSSAAGGAVCSSALRPSSNILSAVHDPSAHEETLSNKAKEAYQSEPMELTVGFVKSQVSEPVGVVVNLAFPVPF